MKQILVNVLTFNEFKKQIVDNRFNGRKIIVDRYDTYWIMDDLVEWEMLETDLLVLLPDGSISTIDGKDIEFYNQNNSKVVLSWVDSGDELIAFTENGKYTILQSFSRYVVEFANFNKNPCWSPDKTFPTLESAINECNKHFKKI